MQESYDIKYRDSSNDPYKPYGPTENGLVPAAFLIRRKLSIFKS